jgi:hypothetical protein
MRNAECTEVYAEFHGFFNYSTAKLSVSTPIALRLKYNTELDGVNRSGRKF